MGARGWGVGGCYPVLSDPALLKKGDGSRKRCSFAWWEVVQNTALVARSRWAVLHLAGQVCVSPWRRRQAREAETGYVLVLSRFNDVSSQVFPYLAAHRALYSDANQPFRWVDTEQLLSDLL